MRSTLRPFMLLLIHISNGYALFPSVCSVVKTPEFISCLNLTITPAVCPFPPRPCVNISYYEPVTFIESVSNPKETFFDKLPGAAMQLAKTGSGPQFGSEEDSGNFSFHAHTLTVPFVNIPFRAMPCDDIPIETFCFSAMSEHVDGHWRTGSADQLQPAFLAWGISPKACLVKGALSSLGPGDISFSPGLPLCSYPNPLPAYPPSARSVCNGWGVFFPRNGTYQGASQTVGALMVADRIRSIGTEVFRSVSADLDEKWQMIYPTQSACFRQGQNVGFLETAGRVNDLGRITSGKLKNYLFVIYKRMSCIKDLPYVASTIAAIGVMKAACQGL